MKGSIVVRGARTHNLKDIDVEIPRDRLVVVTGLSGSGKSSLAFDTIYAEGQRRYVESLSAYARQFLHQMQKPDVDAIDGLAPAIAIEQRGGSRNPRSTVGTITEIYDYLRLLFARVGHAFCWSCGQEITAETAEQIVDRVLALPEGTRVSVLAPVARGKKGELKKELAALRQQGYVRVSVDGELHDLADDIRLERTKAHDVDVYVDRLVVGAPARARLSEAVEAALRLADGLVRVAVVEGADLVFSERFACVDCGITFPEVTPRMFSFNSPHGACPACHGLGAIPYVDADLVVDPALSIEEGALLPWGAKVPAAAQQTLDAVSRHFGFSLATPWREVPEAARTVLLHGSGTEEIAFDYEKDGKRFQFARPVEGLVSSLERRYRETDSESVREEIEEYLRSRTCEGCEGTRLRRECRFVRVGDRSIVDVARLSIQDAHAWVTGLALAPRERAVAARLVEEVRSRLAFLLGTGLEYLSLDRTASSLSGGEAQRIRLATQIGSALVGVLYVLDEPSAGLHARDHARLLQTLRALRDLGNTVLVVEHDEETIRAADHVIDMGPGAGALGGRVVAAGTPAEIARDPASPTGRYLSGARSIPVPARRRRGSGEALVLSGARGHNLRGITLRIPLGTLTCVTGVSGSGKSTAVLDTLHPALARALYGSKAEPQPYDALSGVEHVDRLVEVDQAPIGRTPRSNAASYTGLFTPVRELFAQTPDARLRGWGPARFSFNVKGGRCEACQGDGVIRIEMHFLPDVFVTCEECGGRRYNRETLEVRFRGRSIADVLDLSVDAALEFFAHHERIRERLETLRDVGLGYLPLGQPASTLSGGEAQRVKLSRELAKRATGRTLYLLDEPTAGLHFEDVRRLLEVLVRLVDAGNTVVVIEHHLDVIRHADWVIDLGPEGGAGGGRVVAEGTPEEVARAPGSHTGACLARR